MLKDGIMSPDVADALSFTFYDRETLDPTLFQTSFHQEKPKNEAI